MQEFKKKIHGSGTTTLIISNEKMNDIMKIVQALEDSNILFKGVIETIKNETKEQKGEFLSMLLGTLGAVRKHVSRKRNCKSWFSKRNCKSSFWKRNCKKWLWKGNGLLMLPQPLTNFEIQEYYQNEPRFNGVYSRNNLPKKIKDGAYVINLDEYADVGTHLIALFCNGNQIVYFKLFDVEHVPKEIKEFIGNKNIKANIFLVQANNSRMCGYFCIGFIDFMLAYNFELFQR